MLQLLVAVQSMFTREEIENNDRKKSALIHFQFCIHTHSSSTQLKIQFERNGIKNILDVQLNLASLSNT